MKLGDIISEYREQNNLSQREFARRCGLSNSLISIIEKGYNPQTGKEISPDLETYASIAKVMGITMHELFQRLGNDATVHLISIHSYPNGNGDLFVSDTYERDTDRERLEALHQNPHLGLLFDRTMKMSEEDIDFMLKFADRILKERDEE